MHADCKKYIQRFFKAREFLLNFNVCQLLPYNKMRNIASGRINECYFVINKYALPTTAQSKEDISFFKDFLISIFTCLNQLIIKLIKFHRICAEV